MKVDTLKIDTLKAIMNDDTVDQQQLYVLLERAKKLAKNQYFWHKDDIPTEEELEAFYERYEYEIYDIAVAINADSARDGEIRHEELGVVRVWDKGGSDAVKSVVSAIVPKTYIL